MIKINNNMIQLRLMPMTFKAYERICLVCAEARGAVKEPRIKRDAVPGVCECCQQPAAVIDTQAFGFTKTRLREMTEMEMRFELNQLDPMAIPSDRPDLVQAFHRRVQYLSQELRKFDN